MPLYEYKCSKCQKKIEIIQKVGDPAPTKCPFCGGSLKKLISIPAIQFKGSGWYVTDYAAKKDHLSHANSSESKEKSPQKKRGASKEKTPEQIKA